MMLSEADLLGDSWEVLCPTVRRNVQCHPVLRNTVLRHIMLCCFTVTNGTSGCVNFHTCDLTF